MAVEIPEKISMAAEAAETVGKAGNVQADMLQVRGPHTLEMIPKPLVLLHQSDILRLPPADHHDNTITMSNRWRQIYLAQDLAWPVIQFLRHLSVFGLNSQLSTGHDSNKLSHASSQSKCLIISGVLILRT